MSAADDAPSDVPPTAWGTVVRVDVHQGSGACAEEFAFYPLPLYVMDSDSPSTSSKSRASSDQHPVLVRAFLIADIRGYTRFTQERGDEAAARLASTFAQITRDGVESFDGDVVELRGDEALSVFASARQAIRAALDLQRRYTQTSLENPEALLAVGIGLDAGEAVAVEGGFRGGALNLAARLCSIAGPGHILATDAVTHLARKVDGTTYVDRGTRVLKGLDEPVRIVEIVPDNASPAVRSTDAVLKPNAARPPRVPFEDFSDRIEAMVADRLQGYGGRWDGDPDQREGTFGSFIADQISQGLDQAREGALERGKAHRSATQQSRPLPVASLAVPVGRESSTNMVLVTVIAGVIITLALIVAIVVILLHVL